MSTKRASDIERTTKYGRCHPFWEVGECDVVVRALTIETAEWRACLRESGARFLENMHRQEDVRREADVGSRRDYNTRVARHDASLASLIPFDDGEVEKALWIDGKLVINVEWLRSEMEQFYEETASISPKANLIRVTERTYNRAYKRLALGLSINQEQRAVPSSTPSKKRGFATRVLRHFEWAVVNEISPRFPSYAQRVDESIGKLAASAREGRARATRKAEARLLTRAPEGRARARAMERDEVQREAIGARPEPPAEPLPPTTVKEPMPDHLESDLLREFWAKHPEDDKHVHIPDDFLD